MKILSILLLVAVMASCGTTRKSIRSLSSEIKKTEFFKKDSAGTSHAETSVKKVDSSHVIEKEESGYERETIEVITEEPYMPSGQDYFDSATFRPLPGGAIPVTRTITRTIREKGQKKTEITQQTAVKEEQQQKQAQAAATSETTLKDTTTKIQVKEKDVKRTGLNWYGWVFVIAALLGLILYYRPSLLKAWRWILYRLFGHKP